MAQLLSWDPTGSRFYETGLSKGVLYPLTNGEYGPGVAWNGLVSVTEQPGGAEPTPLYANNSKYITLMSAEELALTIEAFTYPDEFAACDGSVEAEIGVTIGQQTRATFGLCYRTIVGNDESGNDLGYKLHLVYGCKAAPSERGYNTVNESPEAITFSWGVSTVPVANDYGLPTSMIVIDSRTADPTALAALEVILYGATGTPDVPAEMPMPNDVIAMMEPGN